MKPYLKLLFTISTFCLLISCNNSTNSKTISRNGENTDAAIQVTMEGKTHTMQQKDVNPINVTFENDSLQFLFYTNDNPFQLNFNLNNTDIINKGSATYSIPEANAMKTKVDLNFYNNDRDAKRNNKRIIFRKGTINIKQLTKNKLQMTFEGEGGGMMDRKNNFPISGKVNISY